MSTELSFSYQIKRSARANHVRIVVKPGQVEVVAPAKGISENTIHQFMQERRAWVEQSLAKITHILTPLPSPIPDNYVDGMAILYQGKMQKLWLKPSLFKRPKIEFNGDITVHLPVDVLQEQRNEVIRNTLLTGLKQQALLQVQYYVEQHSGKKNLVPRNISIRSQKSRWGSCGIHGDIQINWLLVLAPPEMLEYVVVHELCHLEFRDHSKQFWHLVAEHLPDHKQRRQWLKTQGRGLMAFHR
jgi:predicted metal-dependent hydrolase